MPACNVKDSAWPFARSSGGFENWLPGSFPPIWNEQKTALATTIARTGMDVPRAGAMRDNGIS
jgi:hypothetical protein